MYTHYNDNTNNYYYVLTIDNVAGTAMIEDRRARTTAFGSYNIILSYPNKFRLYHTRILLFVL